MKFILASLLALNLAACANSSDDKKNDPAKNAGGAGTGNSDKPMTNETDYSGCDAGTHNGASPEGRWQMQTSNDNFQLQITMSLKNNIYTVSNECRFQGRSLTAAVSTFARYGNGDLQIIGRADQKEEIKESDFQMSCTASIEPMKLHYSFRGSCLVLSPADTSGDPVVLVPAN